ncbi:NADH-quinone oxidoreductase subunit NuoH [Pyrodictium abyssi]|uniref:NADH-quinone oxidoreductase subunit NuoH n=1 Tax=Pyrodictium abyssi TaxID=54256 RepID=A0ABM8IWH0_9CREN|nr:NADH-quinone oxidoreductase subunit NuoH [Pyrodictium abyssi]
MVFEAVAGLLGAPEWLVRAVFAPLVYPGLLTFTFMALFLIWAERKIAARVQMRVGPYYVSPRLHGALQMIADGVKFAFQEIIVPLEAEKWSFILSPILAFTIVALSFTVVPGGPGVYGFQTEFSILVAYALITIAPILTIIMGWASSNKFAYIGAGREALVSITGEATILASMLAAAMMYGVLDFTSVVEKQISTGVIGLVANPIAALLFFIAALLATDRVPFDLVLGEQEIVQGPYTEYSGLLFALTMAIDYAKLYVLMLMFTHLFLGGWMPFTDPLLGSLAVLAKTTLLLLLAVFLRAVYARMRLDQVAAFFWARLFPLALIAFAVSAIVHQLYAG